MKRYTIAKPEHGSQAWLDVRWQTEDKFSRISASAAAAVHNEHDYMTAGDLAVELLADESPKPKPTNKAMDRGNRLEPVMIQWTCDLEKIDLLTPDVMYCYEDGDARMIATLDGIYQDVPFEIKTSKKRWTGELPRQWYWQGIQQSICVGSNVIEWRIFDNELELHQYTQRISSDEQQIHIEAVRNFLNSIDQGLTPEVAELSYKNVTDIYTKPNGSQAMLPEQAIHLIDLLEKAKKTKKYAEEQEDGIKAELASLMKDAEEGVYNGDIVVTWKPQTRVVFDTARFDSEHPALSEKYRKNTTFRVLKTKARRK